MAVKLSGAAYLVWLGISLFRSKAQEDVSLSHVGPRSGRGALAESVTVEVLNPKTAIFYLAFLPQFVDAAASFPVWVQFVLLGTVVNVMFSVADLVAVALADTVVSKLRRSSAAQRAIQRAGGAILVGLGAQLALQRS
jgi:threonine/homoserine/homoserine lactone efflux protein